MIFVEAKSMPKQALGQRGFGLVEILIALTLGIVIILGVTTLFSDTSRTLTDISRTGRQVENGLFALEMLSTDLSLAGYWGEAGNPVDAENQIFVAGETPSVPPSPTLTLPPPLCVGTGKSYDSSYDVDNAKAELAFAMEFPVYSVAGIDLETSEFGNEKPCGGSPPSPRGSSEVIAIRRVSTCAAGSTNCRSGDNNFHLQTNGCYDPNNGITGGEIKLYKVADPDAASVPELPYLAFNCKEAMPDTAPRYRFVSRIYYVDDDDRLVRLFLDEDVYTWDVLVEGVEVLWFEFYIDSTGDGQPNEIKQGVTGTDPITNEWPNVVGAKVWTVVRSTQSDSSYEEWANCSGSAPDGVTAKSYEVAGRCWEFPSGNEKFRRSVQSRTVDLINISGIRR